MKTLDEVINAMAFEQQYNASEWTELDADALAYLRKYREEDKELGHAINKACNVEAEYNRLVEDLERNDPLTWDKLREMGGKPVWIEAEGLSVGVSPYRKDWYIIKSFSNEEFMYCNDGFVWAKEMQARLWQAYRKERE